MARKIKLSTGAWQMDLEMTITVVDEEKFKEQCIGINNFWGGQEGRAQTHGSHEKAGLAVFATECFQLMSFNNFKDEEWLVEQFDWSKNKGVEGYPSIDDLGVKIDSIEPWFIDSDDIEIEELAQDENDD